MVSTTNRMMILFVLESPIVVVARCAQWREEPRQNKKTTDGMERLREKPERTDDARKK